MTTSPGPPSPEELSTGLPTGVRAPGSIDPELAVALGRLPEVGTEARLDDMGLIRSLRDSLAIMDALGTRLASRPAVHVENVAVPGRSSDRSLLVRLYRPAAHGGGALLFLHGGAYVLGDVYVEEERCLDLAAGAQVVVASVEYGLAPEERFPAGLEDAYAGLRWLVAESPGLGVDPRRVAVGGSSAGAGLAAALSLAARERGGPEVAFQLLVYPMLDDRQNTPSMALKDTPLFSARAAADAWLHYLGPKADPADDGPAARFGSEAHLAAPARAADLTGLPPAYVMVAEIDPLRDEGIAYARRLAEAGVGCELHLFPATFHGFDIVGSQTAVGRRALGARRRVRRPARRPARSEVVLIRRVSPRHGTIVPVRVRRTFAFLDLSGFTSLTATEGDERSVAVLGVFRGALRRTCSRRGVRIAKWLGDGAMLVGVETTPVASAALELMCASELVGENVNVKCGITAGPVILLEGDDYIGHAVNVAARLCDLAHGGQVLADPVVVDALPAWARAGDRHGVAVRGVVPPVDVVELSLYCPPGASRPDPVCGIPLAPSTATAWRSAGDMGRWLFCSDSCLDTWERRPSAGADTPHGASDEVFVRDGIA